MTNLEFIKIIPVFPKKIKAYHDRFMLAADLLIIEDDHGGLSWVSEEAKQNAIKDMRIKK